MRLAFAVTLLLAANVRADDTIKRLDIAFGDGDEPAVSIARDGTVYRAGARVVDATRLARLASVVLRSPVAFDATRFDLPVESLRSEATQFSLSLTDRFPFLQHIDREQLIATATHPANVTRALHEEFLESACADYPGMSVRVRFADGRLVDVWSDVCRPYGLPWRTGEQVSFDPEHGLVVSELLPSGYRERPMLAGESLPHSVVESVNTCLTNVQCAATLRDACPHVGSWTSRLSCRVQAGWRWILPPSLNVGTLTLSANR